jgi:hypothetical protein
VQPATLDTVATAPLRIRDLWHAYLVRLDRRSILRRNNRFAIRKLIWQSGLALIAIGILCLSLSGAVARTGSWWQGTWQALGVGFVVGGIVDVLAISFMSQYSSARQRYWNDAASELLRVANDAKAPTVVAMIASWYLAQGGNEIDPGLRRELRRLETAAKEASAAEEESQARSSGGRGETPT